MRQAKLRQKLVTYAKKFYYPFLLFVNVQTLKIGDIDHDSYLLNDKFQYISLDKSIKTGILVMQSNQPKPTQKLSKEPV